MRERRVGAGRGADSSRREPRPQSLQVSPQPLPGRALTLHGDLAEPDEQEWAAEIGEVLAASFSSVLSGLWLLR